MAFLNNFGFYAKVSFFVTGKSLSEALICAPTTPQYDARLFIELQVQYMTIPSSNLRRTCCVQKLFLAIRTIFAHNMFSPCSAKRRASDNDLPVQRFSAVIDTIDCTIFDCNTTYVHCT